MAWPSPGPILLHQQGWPCSGPGSGRPGQVSGHSTAGHGISRLCKGGQSHAPRELWLSQEVQTKRRKEMQIKHHTVQHQRAIKRRTWDKNRKLLDYVDSCTPLGHIFSVKVKARKSLTEHEDPLLEVLLLPPSPAWHLDTGPSTNWCWYMFKRM